MLAQQRIQDLERCWHLGTIGITDPLGTESDDEALRNFNENVKFRYQVILPWKSGCEELPDNYNVAVMRLKSLLIKFQVDKKLLQNYENIIHQQLNQGIIELVSTNTRVSEKKYCMLYLPVPTPGKATKYRKMREVQLASYGLKIQLRKLDIGNNLVVYCYCHVPFGLVCTVPFCWGPPSSFTFNVKGHHWLFTY